MKITKNYLKRLIKEELGRVEEGDVIDAASRFKAAGERSAEEPSGDVRYLTHRDREDKVRKERLAKFFTEVGDEFGRVIKAWSKDEMTREEVEKSLDKTLIEKAKSARVYVAKYFDFPGESPETKAKKKEQEDIFRQAVSKYTKKNIDLAFNHLRKLLNMPGFTTRVSGPVSFDDSAKGYTRRKPSVTDDM